MSFSEFLKENVLNEFKFFKGQGVKVKTYDQAKEEGFHEVFLKNNKSLFDAFGGKEATIVRILAPDSLGDKEVVIKSIDGNKSGPIDQDLLIPLESKDKEDVTVKQQKIKQIISLATKARTELEKAAVGVTTDMKSYNELIKVVKELE